MRITDTRRRRVIINSDVKNEADDQFAIVHALLSPTLDVRGLIPAHFGTQRTSDSLKESHDELELLIELLGREEVTRADGAPRALPDTSTPVDSPGARLIIEESRRTDAGTLFVAFLGPLTDMASAILLAPDIVACDLTVIWIGGPPYGDVESVGSWPEYNLKNDVNAANVVFDSGVDLWQVPSNVYRLINVSYAEMRAKVEPHGHVGRYLVQQVADFNAAFHKVPIESRSLGDSPAVALMLEPWCASFRRQEPVRFSAEGGYERSSRGKGVRVVESIDTRYLLEDFFAKLAEFGARSAGPDTGASSHGK